MDIHPSRLREDIINDPYLGLEIANSISKEIYKYSGRLVYLDNLAYILHEILHNAYIDYYDICENIIEDFNKKRIPWLKEIYEDVIPCLTYKYGKIDKESKVPYPDPAVFSFKFDEDIDFTKIFSSFDTIDISKNETIAKENQIADEFFILMEGQIDIYKNDRKYASLSGQGACFGEVEMLLKYNSVDRVILESTYITAKDSKVIQIPTPRLARLFAEIPELGYYFFHFMKNQYPLVQQEYSRIKKSVEKYIEDIGDNVTENIVSAHKNFQRIINMKSEDEKHTDSYLDNSKEKQREISSLLRKNKNIFKAIINPSFSNNKISEEIKRIEENNGNNNIDIDDD